SAVLFGARPEDSPLALVDRDVVDARLSPAHQPVLVELPELVAVAAPPAAVPVVALVLEADRDPVGLETPEVLPQRIVELALPLLSQECHDLLATGDESVAIAPDRVDRVRARDPLGLTGVPGILCRLHLLRRCLVCERRQRRLLLGHDAPFVSL